MNARAGLIIVTALVTPACTLLVNFVDAPDAGEASVKDVVVEATLDAGGEPEVKPEAGYDASKVCKGLMNGWYCGYNGLNGSPPPDWLVDCIDGGPVVRVCDAGCLAFPSGTSDRCNECPGMPNGNYCGSQFSTYQADNGPYLISCAEGLAAIQVDCANGCAPGPGTAACK